MAFIVVPNTLYLQVFYLQDGQQTQNGIYFDKSPDWTLSDINLAVDAFSTAWELQVMPELSQDIEMRGVKGTDLGNQFAAVVEKDLVTPVAGGRTADMLPNNCSWCISFKTQQRGRSRRGRIYIPGIPENEVSANTISLTWSTLILSALNGVVSAVELTGSGIRHVVVSRTTSPATVTPVSEIGAFDRTIDSQRRRLPGRGQ